MAPSLPQAVFVYGTLLPGHLRWPLLDPVHVDWRPASVSGSLYDTGQGWPAAVFSDADRAGAPSIPGALVHIEPAGLAGLLIELDEVEEVPHIFRRVEISTTDGDPAWAWEWARAVDGLRRIDRWHPVDER